MALRRPLRPRRCSLRPRLAPLPPPVRRWLTGAGVVGKPRVHTVRLKQRGLLEDTLVVWGGEFGRTPMMQGALKPDQIGRDHHPHGYTIWMAGGGIKPGIVHGATDEFGFYAVDKKVHVHDLHATLLHLLGLEHTRLTYRSQGRDFRLTDVHGEVVKAILA